jgi:hypothetical protein
LGLPTERRIEFRCGVHLGDVVEESDGDLVRVSPANGAFTSRLSADRSPSPPLDMTTTVTGLLSFGGLPAAGRQGPKTARQKRRASGMMPEG